MVSINIYLILINLIIINNFIYNKIINYNENLIENTNNTETLIKNKTLIKNDLFQPFNYINVEDVSKLIIRNHTHINKTDNKVLSLVFFINIFYIVCSVFTFIIIYQIVMIRRIKNNDNDNNNNNNNITNIDDKIYMRRI